MAFQTTSFQTSGPKVFQVSTPDSVSLPFSVSQSQTPEYTISQTLLMSFLPEFDLGGGKPVKIRVSAMLPAAQTIKLTLTLTSSISP